MRRQHGRLLDADAGAGDEGGELPDGLHLDGRVGLAAAPGLEDVEVGPALDGGAGPHHAHVAHVPAAVARLHVGALLLEADVADHGHVEHAAVDGEQVPVDGHAEAAQPGVVEAERLARVGADGQRVGVRRAAGHVEHRRRLVHGQLGLDRLAGLDLDELGREERGLVGAAEVDEGVVLEGPLILCGDVSVASGQQGRGGHSLC